MKLAATLLLFASLAGAQSRPPELTVADLNRLPVVLFGRDNKALLKCDVVVDKVGFHHCVLAEGVSLDDVAMWVGYSSDVMSKQFDEYEKVIARLRRIIAKRE